MLIIFIPVINLFVIVPAYFIRLMYCFIVITVIAASNTLLSKGVEIEKLFKKIRGKRKRFTSMASIFTCPRNSNAFCFGKLKARKIFTVTSAKCASCNSNNDVLPKTLFGNISA